MLQLASLPGAQAVITIRVRISVKNLIVVFLLFVDTVALCFFILAKDRFLSLFLAVKLASKLSLEISCPGAKNV